MAVEDGKLAAAAIDRQFISLSASASAPLEVS
jgi:hypothetical protein